MTKKFLPLTLALSLSLGLAAPAGASAVQHFSDVPATHWAYQQVERSYADGVMEGTGGDPAKGTGLFHPDVTLAVQHFSDVPATHWAYQQVERSYADGVMEGTGGDPAKGTGLFHPDVTLTMAQFITILGRGFYGPEVQAELDKGNASPWYAPAQAVGAAHGLIAGTKAGMEEPVSRYDMAAVMTNILRDKGFALPTQGEIGDFASIPANYKDAVTTVFSLDIITGTDEQGTFAGDRSVDRAQAAVLYGRLKGVLSAATHWAYQQVERSYADGVMEGTGGDPAKGTGLFRPDVTLTMAQFITILGRGFYGPEVQAELDQGNAAPWYAPAQTVGTAHGLFAGTKAGMEEPVSRYDMALVMTNILQDKGFALPTEREMAETDGVMEGTGGDPAKGTGLFRPDVTLTMAQFITILGRGFYGPEVQAELDQGNAAPWYAPAQTVGTAHGLFAGTKAGMEEPVSRYDMALVMTNILQDKGFALPTEREMAETQGEIGDFASIPAHYQDAVTTVFSLDLITGTDEQGTFAGTAFVDRAQAAVLYGRLKGVLSGGSQTPAGPEQPVESEQPVTPETPAAPSNVVGTISSTPVTLSLDTHKPIVDYWSEQSDEIKGLTDKDAFNAAQLHPRHPQSGHPQAHRGLLERAERRD